MTTLDEVIDTLNRLGAKDAEAEVARRGATGLETLLARTLGAGTAPDGTAWKLRKKDGGRPYQHAASRLSVKAYGNVIRAVVTAPDAWGAFGVRGAPVRTMVPDAGAGTPAEVVAVLDAAAVEWFEEVTK